MTIHVRGGGFKCRRAFLLSKEASDENKTRLENTSGEGDSSPNLTSSVFLGHVDKRSARGSGALVGLGRRRLGVGRSDTKCRLRHTTIDTNRPHTAAELGEVAE